MGNGWSIDCTHGDLPGIGSTASGGHPGLAVAGPVGDDPRTSSASKAVDFVGVDVPGLDDPG